MRVVALAMIVTSLFFAFVVACTSRAQSGSSNEAATPSPTPTSSAAPAAGQRAPTFTRTSVSGETVQIPSTKKEGTVLIFAATWSSPDMHLVGRMQELQHLYPEVAFVAVSIDEEEKDVAKVFTDFGARYPIVWDQGHVISQAYRPSGDPMTYVIDKMGIVRGVHLGFHEGQEQEIERDVAAFVKTDICQRPLLPEDGRVCFRQCARRAKEEAKCTTAECKTRCSAATCRETCTRENKSRNDSLAFCRQMRPPKRENNCTAVCHSEEMNQAFASCNRHAAAEPKLVAECESVCGLNTCYAKCR
jgi:peroxiredoxin